MTQALAGIDFAPVLPLWLIAALGVVAVLALVPAFLRRARGAALRALVFGLLLLALGNPRLVEETRETRPDIALLVVDRSDSARIGRRAAQLEAARAAVEARAARLSDLELRTIEVPEGGNQGTRLFAAAERALAEIPRARLAGVIALTDGQVHDVPAQSPVAAPFHALLPGRPGEVDRRLRVVEAPGFGIVGKSVELRVAVEDLGAAGSGAARLSIRRDGAAPRIESVPLGREHRIAIPIERGGPTVVELAAEARPGEVSELNNRAVVTITGVRDRLRVLLVSGEPHAGERTWRRLLKADPGVDLVHFTILRPPEKDDLTPLNELALIAFPVRELFQVKLREFDLVVFDRFANRGILPPAYLRNIADYVRGGGALLLSVGPEFAGPTSLAATPLGAVLPARPAAGAGQPAAAEGAFRPHVTALGARHPVTEGLTGANPDEAAEARWGRWYRSMRADARAGATVMEAAGGAPLLVLDRVGEGRVALLLSDHIWLWSRGHDGGGPQAELLRRAAHWLMREPELEEEDLTARIDAGQMTVQRRSVEPGPPPEISITAPDGGSRRQALESGAGGHATARLPADQPGVWQVSDGRRTAFAAAAAANPPEVADLRADPARLAPILAATGGAARWLGEAAEPAVPELRRVAPGRDTQGGDGRTGWIGLRRNGDHTVTGIAAMPLLPPWLALPLVLGLAVLGWRREGR
ncbi:hypothetical protein QWZ14_25860 [Paeniroseomonas aquatica]|uniref:Glutamine amidotransferase domain-containing protein n=1 Tax=Paeniroseomonas aquatica TaxID=373043 RepID=A0ABT8ADT2_9PROT|nr:hypothetical protein [Paeniroseomonas aquatica]MDN3567820.1 hypothetical protein [Paeniroseomonas aquatica]